MKLQPPSLRNKEEELAYLREIRDAANKCRLRGLTKREAVQYLREHFAVPGGLRFAANRAFTLAYSVDGDSSGR